MEDRQPILSAKGIWKSFGGVPVLRDVAFDAYAGEVHALVGENGAGKSTLTKIICGVHRANAGEIRVDGRVVVSVPREGPRDVILSLSKDDDSGQPADGDVILRQAQDDEFPTRDDGSSIRGGRASLHSPADAQALGIALLHQEPLVFPTLDVAENVFAGRQPRTGASRRVDWRAMRQRAGELLKELGQDLDPHARMEGLSVANQQMVEMARAMSLDARILILDEPTASLSPSEVADLFAVVRRLCEKGAAVVFISHRLEEVFELCARITVLRDGELIGTVPAAEITHEDLIRMMVGRELSKLYERAPSEPGALRLEVAGLSRNGEFSDVSLDVRAGEIVGVAGLVGAGRTQVADALFGVTQADAGSVKLDGTEVRIGSPEQALAHGMAYVPEDRQQHGVLLPMPIAHNITLPRLRDFARAGWLQLKRERAAAEEYARRLQMKGMRDVSQPAAELSGGNQQKVALAKWLLTEPRVIILDEPTRGVDIGAKAEIYKLIEELARQGMAILMISSELPEVLAMSDRIVVMCEGRVTGRFSRGEATQELIMAAATAHGGTA